MKKVCQYIMFLLIVVCLAGCAHNNLNHHKKILQRSSFLKVEKVLVVKSCVNENGMPKCNERKLRSSGSGAVVKSTWDGGYVLTAAHVCDDSDVAERIKLMEPNAELVGTMEVRDINGDLYSTEVVDLDFVNDICMLWVPNLFEAPLLVATKAPEPGDRVYNMAAPLGVVSADMVPIFTGFYNGVDHRNMAIYSLPAFGGSSGSPIVNSRGELVGMIHSTLRFFPEIAISPNYKAMRKFINRSIQKNVGSRIVNVFWNVIFR